MNKGNSCGGNASARPAGNSSFFGAGKGLEAVEYDLELLMDSVLSGIAKMRYQDGLVIEYANKGLYDILKCTKEEFQEKNENRYDSVILPEDWKKLCEKIETYSTGGEQFEFEYRVRTKTGSVGWRLMNGTPVRQDGCIILYCSVFDITKLKETERHLDSLVENFPGGIFRVFYNGDVVELEYISEGVTRLTGYTTEEYRADGICKAEKDRHLLFCNEAVLKKASLEQAFYLGKGDRREYQITRKDGTKRWVELRSSVVSRSEAGVLIQYIMLDINERKKAEEQARKERIRLDVVAGLSTDSIFEYDIEKDTMHYYNRSETFMSAVMNEPVIEHYTEKLLDGSMSGQIVHKDDYKRVTDICRQLRTGQPDVYCEIRKQYEKGKYVWIAIEGKTVKGEDGQAATVIGKMSNIEERVQREAALKVQSERDSLTGVYNSKVIRKMISERISLKQQEKGYIIIADVDNFKSVNDTMGHLFGDAVICTFAESLTTFFGDALVGRIGGDEFLLYVTGMSMEEITNQVAALNSRMARIHAENMTQQRISASFGVTECQAGITLDKAVRQADSALYFMKNHVKGGITEYHDGMRMNESALEGGADNEFVPEAKINSEGDLITFALELFEHVKDSKGAIRILSDRISRFFDFQDILYIKKDNDGSMKKLFHWGENDVQQFYNTYIDFRQASEWNVLLFESEKTSTVLLERDMVGENIHRAKSMLSIRLTEQDMEGYMIYVDRRKERGWEEELPTLEKLSQIIFKRIVDLEQKRCAEEYAEYMVSHDKITGLWNYTYFLSYCGEYIRAHPEKRYLLTYVDFSNFQYLNEIYGYEAGDQVLKIFAEQLQKGTGILYARATADKFLALHEIKEDVETLKQQFLMFNESFCSKINSRYDQCKLGIVGGMAEVDLSLESFTMNVDNANIARKAAKRDLQLRLLVYTPELREEQQRRMEILSSMTEALEAGEFVMYLQPKMNMMNNTLVGAEALVRWVRSDGTVVPPDKFVPIFEKNGFITKIDFEILRQVLELQRAWKEEGKPVLPVSVNFSRKHQENSGDIEKIVSMIEDYGVSTDAIEIEITESVFMYDIRPLIQSVAMMKKYGMRISIDDFGAGYSSLNVLANVKADTIKLDQKFLFDVSAKQGTVSKEFLHLLIPMIRQIGFQVIAEGVETEEQVAFLKNTGCHYAQGYYYAEPMKLADFLKFMETHAVDAE